MYGPWWILGFKILYLFLSQHSEPERIMLIHIPRPHPIKRNLQVVQRIFERNRTAHITIDLRNPGCCQMSEEETKVESGEETLPESPHTWETVFNRRQ